MHWRGHGRKGGIPANIVSIWSRLLRKGDSATGGHLTLVFGIELHWRAIVDSAKGSWLVDINHFRYLRPGFLSNLDAQLRRVNAVQTALNDWWESGRRTLVYSLFKACTDDPWENSPEEPSEASIPPYAVVVSALVLLTLVYQYLTGNVDRGGSRAYYSRSSLDFRDIYVATVLFLGAYVWIKFREVALRGVHKRKRVDRKGRTKVVYDARLAPPMCNGQKVQKLELGRFPTEQEAHHQFLIAAFYYNRGTALLDGWFPVPPMSEEERSFTGEVKKEWVISQSKKVYKNYKRAVAYFQDLSALVPEPSEAREGQATQEHVQVNVDPLGTSFLHPAEHQQPAIVSQAENSGTGVAMIGDNHGLERAAHSLNGMHEGPALPDGHSLEAQERSALPVSQLPPNRETGMSLNGSDPLDSVLTRLDTIQQQLEEFRAQILQVKHQRHTPQ